MDIVILLHGTGISLHLIGIKDQNQVASLIALVITADIHKLIPGAVDIHLRQIVEIRPGEDDIVAIH